MKTLGTFDLVVDTAHLIQQLLNIPNLDGAVEAGRGEVLSVGREGDRINTVRVGFDRDEGLVGCRFPQTKLTVATAGCEELTVW